MKQGRRPSMLLFVLPHMVSSSHPHLTRLFMPTAELTKEDAQQPMIEGGLIYVLVKQLGTDETFDGAQNTLFDLSKYGWLSIAYIISPYLTRSKISFERRS
jgi:hypothetical protein